MAKDPPDSGARKSYSLYIIDCDGRRLYTGITTDVERRWREHLGLERGGASATRIGDRLDLVYSVEVGSRSLASRLEARMKRLSRREKQHIVQHQPDFSDLARRLGLDLEGEGMTSGPADG